MIYVVEINYVCQNKVIESLDWLDAKDRTVALVKVRGLVEDLLAGDCRVQFVYLLEVSSREEIETYEWTVGRNARLEKEREDRETAQRRALYDRLRKEFDNVN